MKSILMSSLFLLVSVSAVAGGGGGGITDVLSETEILRCQGLVINKVVSQDDSYFTYVDYQIKVRGNGQIYKLESTDKVFSAENTQAGLNVSDLLLSYWEKNERGYYSPASMIVTLNISYDESDSSNIKLVNADTKEVVLSKELKACDNL